MRDFIGRKGLGQGKTDYLTSVGDSGVPQTDCLTTADEKITDELIKDNIR